ncbi:NAD(P)/FAD-dependent oxidoreductase [Amycolatopsis sp. Poz14]|uniref:flavin-containing monooxygenase n=1 Tax=Amycolatopsis sp. Poz14 TaxID=1447705 RepID=UPI001EE9AD60|nr:NAD(P)/FAD-dependent oxidoreductase [Amycolatopsis sp. Poz14]MCG3754082.1 NAD(P)/FAD-dependent oxidoreductase [Amycolatopsis sp. Poz14]
MTSNLADPRRTAVTASDEQLRAALAVANIPTLVIVLAQLTGDEVWLADRYRPTRSVALNDNDTAGLPGDVQGEIRTAAFDAVRALRDGERQVPAPPCGQRLVDLLSFSLGETVLPEYAEPMALDAGFAPHRELSWPGERPASADDRHVLVIGAGSSGIAASIALQELGIPHTVVEKNAEVGGVWLVNDYPGAGVDTPAHLYSYSFAPRLSWSRYYAKQPEVLTYLDEVATKFDVKRHIHFGTEVVAARWDDSAQRWHVTLKSSAGITTTEADVVLSCAGNLNQPFVPDFPCLETFAGPTFHSSRWDHSVDLAGKRVAVVGTGATAMQIVPAIAGKARHTAVFQRTPQWVVPNANYLRDTGEGTRLLMDQVPYYAGFYRLRLVWQFQDKLLATLRRDPKWEHPDRSVNATNDKHRAFLAKAMEDQLGEDLPRLRDQVIPAYPPYLKRILMDNEWIPTLRRDDVELVAEAVTGFDETHVHTADGRTHEADVVVLATGFQSRKMLWPMDIVGRSGISLRERWGDDDASAYLGITVPDFPNFFVVGGPHTTLAHGGSAIAAAECALGYSIQAIARMITDGLSSVEVRAEVADEYDRQVDAEHEQLVWSHPGATNWYRNKNGRVVAAMPWRLVDYWALTREPDLDEYHVRSRRD